MNIVKMIPKTWQAINEVLHKTNKKGIPRPYEYK